MILFVDDESHRVENDIDELCSRGYEVRLEETLAGALRFLENNRQNVDAIISDVMMPHGTSFTAEQTRDGLNTGVNFFDWVRERWPELPFIVFTNVSNAALRQRFEQEPRCFYLEKRDVRAEELADKVHRLISPCEPSSDQQ